MALRAGVAVADVEFMQFHPTALHHPAMPRPLLSEALRGEGAILRDEHGVAFMASEHPLADLAPRDVVATRDHPAAQRARARPPLARRHRRSTTSPPASPRSGRRAGRSGSTRPATGCRSRRPRTTSRAASAPTSTARRPCPGLWACGEAACSGVHGANRLASNSLLDGLVFGPRTVRGDRRAGRTAPTRPACCAASTLPAPRRRRPARHRRAPDGAAIRDGAAAGDDA